jgi:hypothetical protein
MVDVDPLPNTPMADVRRGFTLFFRGTAPPEPTRGVSVR